MVVIMYIIYSYNLSLNPSESNVQFLLPRICLKRVSNLQFLDTILLKNSLRWIHRHPLTADWFELHRCPPIMKSGVRYPLTTKKNRKEGEDLSRPVQFFLSSLPGVYVWAWSSWCTVSIVLNFLKHNSLPLGQIQAFTSFYYGLGN